MVCYFYSMCFYTYFKNMVSKIKNHAKSEKILSMTKTAVPIVVNFFSVIFNIKY